MLNDDYELFDKDHEQFLQIGRAAGTAEAEAIVNDESRDWSDRIQAAAAIQYIQGVTNMPKGERLDINAHKRSRNNLHIACEEIDFTWSREEMNQFIEMWKEGKSVQQIAIALDRDPDEVLILVIDRSRENMIKKRPGGVLGKMPGKKVCGA